MHAKKKLLILFMVTAFMVLAAVNASAVVMTVGTVTGSTSETLQVPITVDDPTGIAGAAFTLDYNSSNISITVDSTFFDTFANQFAGTPAEGTDSVTVDGQTYYQPLLTNPTTNTLKIAAARATPADDSNNVLFTLYVDLIGGPGTYDIKILQTEPNNADAGWAAGEKSPILIQAGDPALDPTDVNAFPVVLDPENSIGSVVDGQVTFVVPDLNITGTVAYSGSQTGTLHVASFTDDAPTTPIGGQTYSWQQDTETQSFSIPVGSGTYTVKAFIDSDGSGNIMDNWEANGSYGPVTLTDADVDIGTMNLTDPDGPKYKLYYEKWVTDNNYWDITDGDDTNEGPNDDYDEDGYTNIQEFEKGTDPTVSDFETCFGNPKTTPTWMDLFGKIYNASNQEIADGDEVAAFVDDGQGGLLLVGIGIYGENVSGSYGLIHVYGDDYTTTEKDGAQAGDTIILKTCNKQDDKIYPLRVLSGGDITFAEGQPRELNWKYLLKQIIPLHKGWNLISFGASKCFYIDSQPTAAMLSGIEYEQVGSISDILSSIDGQYSYVRGFDVSGAKSYNLTPFSDMKYMAAGYGYWIKVRDDASVDLNGLIYLELEGFPVPGTTHIQLHEGWNLVGYLGNKIQYRNSAPTVPFPEEGEFAHISSDNIGDAFSSISGQYSYARGFDKTGAKSYNLTPFSDMKYVGPGYGYWIKVNESEIPVLIWED